MGGSELLPVEGRLACAGQADEDHALGHMSTVFQPMTELTLSVGV